MPVMLSRTLLVQGKPARRIATEEQNADCPQTAALACGGNETILASPITITYTAAKPLRIFTYRVSQGGPLKITSLLRMLHDRQNIRHMRPKHERISGKRTPQ